MSLQDDYYDLKSKLEGADLEAFEKIWTVFCEMESGESGKEPAASSSMHQARQHLSQLDRAVGVAKAQVFDLYDKMPDEFLSCEGHTGRLLALKMTIEGM